MGNIKLYNRRKKEDGEFYHYKIDDFEFWFTQHDDGNIYGVVTSRSGDKFSGITIYISTNEIERGRYYPDIFTLNTKTTEFAVKEGREFIQKCSAAYDILEKIEEFFKTSIHHDMFVNRK